jgi:hypothetical protein
VRALLSEVENRYSSGGKGVVPYVDKQFFHTGNYSYPGQDNNPTQEQRESPYEIDS